MIPIVVHWTNYTTTVRGRVLKLVPCEHCRTEYVYVLEREGVGEGTSAYGLVDESAQENAESGAHEILGEYLANDFDPVPCPTCGHYQRFMFPKLIETRSPWVLIATLITLGVALVSSAGVVNGLFNAINSPTKDNVWKLTGSAAVLVIAGLTGTGLWLAERKRVRRFDPNATEDHASRLAKGRSRAMTRAEFDARHRGIPPVSPDQAANGAT